ncbi:MAG: hypothetical protein V4717_10600 [Bacteroidota bacterium]
MKKLLLVCLISLGCCFSNTSIAQLNVSVNLAAQPPWGPSGYNHVDYYYLPDMNAYYYVPKKQFIYLEGNNWTFVNSRPAQYKNVDLFKTYKVVINEPKPYLRHNVYEVKYKKYRGSNGKQQLLKDNPGNHYGHYKNKKAINKKKVVVVQNNPAKKPGKGSRKEKN